MYKKKKMEATCKRKLVNKYFSHTLKLFFIKQGKMLMLILYFF